MKGLPIASLISFAVASGSAMAADLYPLKAPAGVLTAPLAAPALSWTGCYINGGAGYGLWNQDEYTVNSPLMFPIGIVDTGTTLGGRGWLGVLGGGCDYQFGSRWLVGAFGDYDFMNLTGNVTNVGYSAITTFPLAAPEKETAAGAVGARFGYLVAPTVLAYVNGGWSRTHFTQANFNVAEGPGFPPVLNTPSGFALLAHNYNGWFVGGGTEMSLGWMPGLLLRTEYRYAGYTSANVPFNCVSAGFICAGPAVTGIYENVTKNVQTVSTSLVWRFNFGAQ